MNSLPYIFQDIPLPLLNHWWYWIILFMAIAEALPLLGIFIPGQMIIIGWGFLAKIGILEIGDVLWVATLGAILGDLIGYLIGKRYGYTFLSKYGKYFFFKEIYLKKTQKLMQGHTGKTLIIGRFNSLTRAFSPFIAGASRIHFLRFMLYNTLGAVAWACCFVLVGYIFGGSYEVIAPLLGKYIFIATVVSIVLILSYRFINKRKRIFTRYHLYALLFNISSLYLFSKMIEDVSDAEAITKLDTWINTHIMLIWSPILNKIMLLITDLASPWILFGLSIILLIIFLSKKRWYHSFLLFWSMSGGLLFEFLTKLIIQRPRPTNGLISVPGYSFPSGHATMAMIFFALIIYAYKNNIREGWRKNLFIITNIVLFLLVGLSRVYLNVHWLSDVIAGWSLGLFWLTLIILILQIIVSFYKKVLFFLLKTMKKIHRR